MDFSNADANMLLSLPKNVVIDDEKKDHLAVCYGSGLLNLRYYLLSEDGEYSFLFEVEQSPKYNIKISLHFQEDEAKIGLLRIDYNGRHTNPAVINSNVPNFMHPYVGKRFAYDEHHIHYHVQGYKNLVWAVPLIADMFPVKQVTDFNSFQQSVLTFAQKINLKTALNFEERLFL